MTNVSQSTKTIAWWSTLAAGGIGALALVGWTLDIGPLKSIVHGWREMSFVTAACIVLIAVQLACMQIISVQARKRFLLHTPAILVGLVGGLTVLLYTIALITGHSAPFAGITTLNGYWTSRARLALLTAILFMLIACAMWLLTTGGRRAAGAAHALMLPAAAAAYLVVVSYILGVQSMHTLLGAPMAMNTGIAFCAVCLAIFCMRPDTWLVRVFTSEYAGSALALRGLPVLLLVPLGVGWLRLEGERHGFVRSDVGVVLVALVFTACLVALVYLAARFVNRAEEALKKSRDELELKVQERTDELKRNMATLGAERQRLNSVLEMMPVYVVLLTPDYHVPFANRFFRERFGESNGKLCYEYLFGRTSPCDICEKHKVLETNMPHHWEWTGPDKHDYDVYDFPFTDVDGSPLIMEMGIDITQRKEVEAALRSSEEQLHRANEMRLLGQLTSGVAHEVRNPLNAITALMAALSQEMLDTEQFRPYQLHMQNQVGRLTSLMEDLLAMGRPVAQEALVEVPLVNITRRALESWRQSLKGQREVAFVAPDTNGHELTIRADEIKMEQVIVNLLDNAHQHSPADARITLTVGNVGDSAACVSITDGGQGIAPDVLPRIFEPFFTTRKGGTGLGLSIVRHVVESHGGRVQASNNDDCPGATFEVILPVAQSQGDGS